MIHRPLVGVVLCFVIGISADYFLNISFSLIFPAILAIMIVYSCLLIFHLKGCVLTLLLLTFLTGVSYHHLRFFSYTTNNISNLINNEKIPVRLRGTAISQPIKKYVSNRPLSSSKRQRKVTTFILQTEAIESTYPTKLPQQSKYGEQVGVKIATQGLRDETGKYWENIRGVIKVNVYPIIQDESTLDIKEEFLADGLKYGDRVELIGNISKPSISRNPGQFDYRKYLHKQRPRVEAIASVVSDKNIKLISENQGSTFFSFVYSLKKRLNAVIKAHVKERSIPLISSILLGERERVSENLIDGFLKTGTIHFLAISGLHVGILVISLHYFLKMLRLNTRQSAIIIIMFTFLYAAITGMKTPIVRASIMVATYYGARLVNRRWDLLNSIAAAVFIILLINPSDLFNVGFQLSVLAVLGIIYISNRIEDYFWKSTLLVEKLQAKEERNEVWFLFKVYCRKTFCVSLAAWIAVMPLIAYYFHIVTPLSALFNIAVLPLIWLILVGGFVVLIIGLTFPVLITPFAWLISYSEITLENIITLLSTNFKTFYYTSGLSLVWISIYYLIVILFLQRERLRIKTAHILIAILTISNIFIFSSFFDQSRNRLKLTCFDVRHGASIFIQFPNGKNMLFDAGTWSNYDIGKFVVAPFLWRERIKKIDAIVISHEHDDHCNGIPSLIERFKVDNVFVNKFLLQSGDKKELLGFISGKKIKTSLISDGLILKGYEPAKITVLNPPDKDTLRFEDFLPNNLSINDSSCVLLIEYMGNKVLLCADIGESGIELLLSGKNDFNADESADLSADLIQVPHHGGFCEKTEDLLKRVRPKYAIISGTENNVSEFTIKAYRNFGVSLLSTYKGGAITFSIDNNGIQASEFPD